MQPGRGLTIVTIDEVQPGSIADRHGIHAGNILEAVNDRPVRDVLEYRFLTADEDVLLSIVSPSGPRKISIHKQYGEDIGLVFRDPLFDGIRRCRNRCIFCFVDQLPGGMRESLYLKDDDYRLSFLQGNFVTLTNLSREDLDRIKEMRLSPLYISVHSTSPETRAAMMQNRRAGDIMYILRELADAGIEMHTQVVLCKGVNDGNLLRKTVMDLSALWPQVRSCGIVPVGVTKYQRYARPFAPISPSDAGPVIDDIDDMAKGFVKRFNSRFVFAADEFYLLAGRPFPGRRYYEGFWQKENGIGIARDFIDSFRRYVRGMERRAGDISFKKRRVSVITGVSGARVLMHEAARLSGIPGLEVRIHPIANDFFGHSVTVSGLVTGGDIIRFLHEARRGTH
ncbi:MAG TPA: DUF512 domain-containing protein, partial [Firmicutes bacterium]|nr:DUF512 domain-containing protein [Bacillota bacterium]